MDETMSKNEVQLEYLRNFLTDIKCLDRIKKYADKFNLFDVFGFAKNEIRHSFVLKWLLDPKENHGLGDAVIRDLLSRLVASEPNRYSDNFAKLLTMDCSDFTVQREVKDIDLLLISEKNSVVIAIENKIGSHEHSSTGYDSQLDKYLDYVKNNIKKDNQLFIYLTPQNETPSDEENWQILSYTDVVEILEEIYKDNRERLLPDVNILIKNYIDLLRRDIVDNTELNKLCNDIYKKHKNALDLIYAHSDMGKTPIEKAIVRILNEYKDQGKVLYDEEERVVFRTPTMTEFLPKLADATSSWGTQYVYEYWFKVRDDKICYVFEIGYKGITDEIKTKLDGFLATRHPRNKKETVKYKRLETSGWEDLNEDIDNTEKTIRRIIEDILKNEIIWIKECKEYLEKHQV